MRWSLIERRLGSELFDEGSAALALLLGIKGGLTCAIGTKCHTQEK